ncbi:MAG: UDP-3-O-(3-hydroxymyristoyl)glucosamine N-acyltransferase [Alphaproteobacteria bacterium]|nr:UDP-3-O-(3-hydroxymyristoyl)glucosamine N-acyltransferase [Alphaproteobacteria bacterium]
MADPRFFTRSGPFRLDALAASIGADIADERHADIELVDVGPLDTATVGTLSFLDNQKYIPAFEASAATACIVAPKFAERAPADMALLLTNEPYKAYARAAAMFYPTPAPEPGIAPTAVIAESASLAEGCRVDAGAVIGENVALGARCHIAANAVIGDAVRIGSDTAIGANASLSHCDIGARVLIHPGVRIGQRGFGFATDPKGHVMVPQLGRVIVGDDVEIGANSTIDRGAGPDTMIGAGTMIDNLVQIGHNVQIGRGCIIIAQAGIAGSTILEDFSVIAAQVGVAGHLRIGSGAQIGALAGVMRDVEPGARMLGTPAVPARQFFRQIAALEKLAKKKGA